MTDLMNGAATRVANRAVGAPAGRPTAETLLREWREAVAQELAVLEAGKASPDIELPDWDARYEAAHHCMVDAADRAWTHSALDVASARLKAEIVQHALWRDCPGTRFESLLGDEPPKEAIDLSLFGERAVAELVKAVLWMAAEPAPAKGPLADALEDIDIECRKAELAFDAVWTRVRDLLARQEEAARSVPRQPANAHGLRKGLQLTIERMWCGLTAMQTLIETCQDKHGGVDEECVTSLGFVLGSLSDLLEDVTKTIDGAEIRPTEPGA